jgi:predicted nucleic acid-binding protein
MKKILIDSSVWVSFFGKDRNSQRASDIINTVLNERCKIIIPEVIYTEVLNCLTKIEAPKTAIAKSMFAKRKFIKVRSSRPFWFKKLENHMTKIKLKTLDLIILGYTLENKIDKFYSFDKRLKKAYQKLK